MRFRARSFFAAIARWGIGLGVGLSATDAGAGADEHGGLNEDATAPPLLELEVVGDLPQADALAARILSWFRGLPTLSSSRRVDALEPQAVFSARERPGVRVWALSRSPELVRLFFAVESPGGERPRYLVRDVALNAGLDELGMEQVAQVVYLSALALWSGQLEGTRRDVEVGLGVTEPPAPPPPGPDVSAPPVRPPPRVRPTVGFEYSGRYAGAEGLSHGPGASVGLVFPAGAFEWGPLLHAQLLLPHREEARGVGLELRGSSFGLGLAAALPAGARDAASAEIGAGLDAVRFRVLSLPEPSFRATSSALDLRPFAYLSAGVRSSVGFVSVGAVGLLAVTLVRTHYDVADERVASEILVPWLLQPGFAIRASW